MQARKVNTLILSGKHDISSDRICHHLNLRKIPFLRINRDDMQNTFLTIDPVSSSMICKYGNDIWHVDESLKSIWWRNPTFLRNTPGRSLDLQEQLQQSQWAAALRGLMLFDNALWMNSPDATYKAESKPYQLRIAKKLGFHVPNTLITNDPSANIIEELGEHIALKSVDTVLLQDEENQYFGFTSLIDWNHCINSDFYLAPATCQKIITPKLDLRVTVVYDQVWCDAITHDKKGIEGDWRVLPKQQLTYSSYNLPNDIKNLCVSLVQKLGLRYGAIDLALSEEIYWFIEINPTGEWGWLDRPKRGIAESIVDNLM